MKHTAQYDEEIPLTPVILLYDHFLERLLVNWRLTREFGLLLVSLGLLLVSLGLLLVSLGLLLVNLVLLLVISAVLSLILSK
ncbi:hypothetical protein ACQKOM_24405 [Peribacillus frigoritolerans]|uniref:hypothetical protein n=1 Tax=Peribacillus frigoritolerans TaxID=450367 RepID=UPI003D03148E